MLGKHFLAYKSQKPLKKNLDNLDFIKIKTLSSSKYTLKKTKRQTKDYEKKFAIHISDKGCTLRTSKELLKINLEKDMQPNFKMGKDLNIFQKKLYE